MDSEPASCRLLFVMRHAGYVRIYDGVLRMLAERGHRIRVAFETEKGSVADGRDTLTELAAEGRDVAVVPLPTVATRVHGSAVGLRLALDHLRYWDPRMAGATPLRERSRQMVPSPLGLLLDHLPMARPRASGATRGILRALERRLPIPPPLLRFLEDGRPDAVLVTPLVQFGGCQTDVLRAARRLGVPSGTLVASWDNLTNKGLLHAHADRLLVWNQDQVREAVELHGTPPASVVATGAQAFDHWFAWKPSTDATEFRRRRALPDGVPLVLYVGSSRFIAPNERAFLLRWLGAVRDAPPPLAQAAVLVRPHPLAPLEDMDELYGLGPATIWPRAGAVPFATAARNDLYDSIFHSDAVVGLNTSVLIESAIVGRPVHTVLDEDTRRTQEGTLHFAYLPRESGGPLHVAANLDAHLAQLARTLRAGREAGDGRAFVERFVRPHGLSEPATPRVVAEIERLASR